MNLISHKCTTHKKIRLCVAVKVLKDVAIPVTNANLDSTKSQQLTMSEFFVFLGCIFSWLALRECQIVRNGGLLFPLMHSKVTLFI